MMKKENTNTKNEGIRPNIPRGVGRERTPIPIELPAINSAPPMVALVFLIVRRESVRLSTKSPCGKIFKRIQ
jgi:hypothetical protein